MLERCHRGPEASAAHPWLERAARQGHAAVRGAKGTTGFSGRCLEDECPTAAMTDTRVFGCCFWERYTIV